MIRYRLQCDTSHEFEAWFGSSTAYDRQAKRGLVECPECGSTKVTKALMAPGVATRSREADTEAGRSAPAATGQPVPVTAETAAQMTAQRRIMALMRQVRQEVESKAEYVGPRFAEEARKIHDNEAKDRGIWGEATIEQARDLHEDGIDCLPLPRLPEDRN